MPGPGEPNNDTWKGDQLEARRRGGLAGRLLRSEDQHRSLGHQQPRSLERVGAQHRRRQLRQAHQPLLGLARSRSTPTPARSSGGYSKRPPTCGTTTASTSWCSPTSTSTERRRRSMMKADRNGFFYVLNRETGKLISAEKYVPTTWATKMDIATGKPVEDPDKRAGPASGQGRLPEPDRRQELAADVVSTRRPGSSTSRPTTLHGLVGHRRSSTRGRVLPRRRVPDRSGPGGYLGELMAWDPVAQKKVWGIKDRPAVQRRHADDGRRPGVRRQSARRLPGHRRNGRQGALAEILVLASARDRSPTRSAASNMSP